MIEPPAPAYRDDELHPEAIDAAVRYSEAIKTAAALRKELTEARAHWAELERQLTSDLALERRLADELRRLLDREKNRADYYVAYATEVKTHLGNVARAAILANDASLKIAEEVADGIRKAPEAPRPAPSEDDPVAAAASLRAVEGALLGQVGRNE